MQAIQRRRKRNRLQAGSYRIRRAASLHAVFMFFLTELGQGGLDLRADANVAEFLGEAVNDDREEHVARGFGRFAVKRSFGIGAEPFAEFLSDSSEAVEGDVLQKFHRWVKETKVSWWWKSMLA